MEISNEYFAEVSNKVATLREEVRTLTAKLTALETAGREVGITGNLMSNVLYNFKQDNRFTSQEKATIEGLQKRWDIAITEFRKAALLGKTK